MDKRIELNVSAEFYPLIRCHPLHLTFSRASVTICHMKLIIAVVQDEDAEAAVQALTEHGYRVTRLATTGGFLRRGNTTLLTGVENDKAEDVMTVLRTTCRRRSVFTTLVTETPTMLPSSVVEVEVGGATVFVLDMEQLVQI